MFRLSMPTSIAARAGAPPDRRLAGRVRGRGCRRSGRAGLDPRRRRRARFGSPRFRSRSPRSRRSSPQRKESSISTSLPARPARRFATCSRTRPASRSRGRSRSRALATDGSTRTRRSACSPLMSPSAPRCPSPSTCARRCVRRSRSGSTRAATPAPGCTLRSRTCSRSDASCSRRASSRTRRVTR